MQGAHGDEEKSSGKISVELSGVTYMDSSGIATLVESRQVSYRSGVRFILAGVTPFIEAVIPFARCNNFFEMAPSPEYGVRAK